MPALQKTFVIFFFHFDWRFGTEKWRRSLVNLLWSPFPRKTKHEKSPKILRGQKVGYGMVADGIAKFQALKFTFQGLKFPVKSLLLLVIRRIPQKFQALKFQNSGPEIWRIHPPPFHITPPFACLNSEENSGENPGLLSSGKLPFYTSSQKLEPHSQLVRHKHVLR